MTCVGYDYRSGHPCSRPSLRVVLAACVHEHIGERALCDWHSDDLAIGLMLCGDCAACREPHECKLREVVAAGGKAS